MNPIDYSQRTASSSDDLGTWSKRLCLDHRGEASIVVIKELLQGVMLSLGLGVPAPGIFVATTATIQEAHLLQTLEHLSSARVLL